VRRQLPAPTTLQLRPPPLRIAPNYEGFTPIGPKDNVLAGVLPCGVAFDDGAWEMQLEVVEEDGQLSINRLSFVRSDGQPSLGTTAIQAALKIRSVEEWAEELVGQQVWRETRPGHLEVLTPPEGRDLLRARRRRRKIDQEHHAETAAVYRDAVSTGYAAPTKAVAEHFHVSRAQAARYVALAREAGALGPTTPGKKGEV
jgi:hypothetical protein